ncbi:DUF7261 family protein [Haloprofundus salilacus]|uniref:DUF7261 family protein n=1 Tax=Haloprofundus salilacus TaxID=2876190 RepID=UPI001CCA37B5|nr:hypothetical protein [Haloprofundus salilacus]
MEERVRARIPTGVPAGQATTAGTQWAETNCPRGPNREFGPCESFGGVVVQERAGDAVVVAVSLDVRAG